MGVNTKRADIVIKDRSEDLFVVELKRHILHEGQEQLFSYLNQLKIDLGILVCDKLYIYYYDFSKKEESYKFVEIPFSNDDPNGIKFIELFSKENFNGQTIKNYIINTNDKKQTEIYIKNELNTDLIISLLRKHFSEMYSINEIDTVLSNYKISIVENVIKNIPQVSYSPASNISNLTYNSFVTVSGKDNTQYSVNGVNAGGKGRTVYEAVKWYIETHPSVTYRELQIAFPDSMAKPGFGKMIRSIDEINEKEWGGSRYNKHPFKLADGTMVTVSTQWKPENMNTFIQLAARIGIEIKPIY